MQRAMSRTLAVLVAPVLIAGASVAAQSQDRSAAEEEVLRTDAGYWEAVNACDPEQWSDYVSDDIVFVLGDGRVHDKDILRYDHFGRDSCNPDGEPDPGGPHNYATDSVRVRVYGEAAVVHGNFGRGGIGDQPRLWMPYTRVFAREGGRWKVVAVHHGGGASEEKVLKASNGTLATSPSR